MLVIAMIPLLLCYILLMDNRSKLTKAICLFILAGSIWQVSVGFLYATERFTANTIEFYYKLMRIGPIMLTPALLYFAYVMLNHPEIDLKKSQKWRKVINAHTVVFVFGWGLLLYVSTWLGKDIVGLTLIEIPYEHHYYYPIAGDWYGLFIANLVLLFIMNMISYRITFFIQNRHVRHFLQIVLFSFFVAFVLGVLNIFQVVGLYLSMMAIIFQAMTILFAFLKTDKKIIEEMNDSLTYQKDFFKKVVNMNPGFVYIKDRDGRFTFVNQGLCQLYNFRSEEIVGKDDRFIDTNQKEATRRVKEDIEAIRNNQKIFNEDTFYTKSGNVVQVQMSKIPLKEADGTPFLLCVAFDITDRIKKEELELEAEKLRVVGQLAASIAHEIRNPLTSIMGFHKFMYETKKDQQKYYEIIDSELKRINEIVDEFMMLAKPQLHKFEKRSIKDIIVSIVRLSYAEANMKNVEIEYVVKTDLPEIWCDENQLKQVFINLIKNAIDSMEEGGKVSIHLTQSNQSEVLIQVRDNGVGIKKERLATLFEPFYTTKEKGTGLGLVVSKRIVKEHSGRIEVESEENKGTTFSIYLPINPKSEAEFVDPQEAEA